MELGAAGLQEQPFRTHSRPLVMVDYEAQQMAVAFMRTVYANTNGLGIFHGPALSGKSTIIHHFAASMGDETAVAIVDGEGLNTTALLQASLSQYGYDLEFDSVAELLAMLKVFICQQAGTNHPPLLISNALRR